MVQNYHNLATLSMPGYLSGDATLEKYLTCQGGGYSHLVYLVFCTLVTWGLGRGRFQCHGPAAYYALPLDLPRLPPHLFDRCLRWHLRVGIDLRRDWVYFCVSVCATVAVCLIIMSSCACSVFPIADWRSFVLSLETRGSNSRKYFADVLNTQ